MRIKCKVIAGARQEKITGMQRKASGWRAEEEVKIWVTAPPVDGKANRAVVKLLAKTLQVPMSAVRIVRGELSNHKLIDIDE